MKRLYDKLSPMKIASLISSGTEILYSLGLEDAIVAVSHECDIPPAAAGKPRITRSNVDSLATSLAIDEQVKTLVQSSAALYEIDVDRLAAMQPDLIITQAQCDVCAVRYADVVDAVATRPELQDTKIIALNPQSLGDVLEDIETIGKATDRLAAAQHFCNRLRQRIETVRHATATIQQRPRVACIEWIEPLMLSGNWMPELVELAGGRHELTEAGHHSPYVPWDDLLAYNPQVVIVMPCGFDLERTLNEWSQLRNSQGWDKLAAVHSGQVMQSMAMRTSIARVRDWLIVWRFSVTSFIPS